MIQALQALARNDAAGVPGGPLPWALDAGGSTGLRLRKSNTDDWVELVTGPPESVPWSTSSVFNALVADSPLRPCAGASVTLDAETITATLSWTEPPSPPQTLVDETLTLTRNQPATAFTTPVPASAICANQLWSVTAGGGSLLTTTIPAATDARQIHVRTGSSWLQISRTAVRWHGSDSRNSQAFRVVIRRLTA